MVDIVDSTKRSLMMSGIRGKNTRPELLVRKALHAAGFRYRLHGRDLPGKPDMIFPKYSAVLFVHGCFWHGHDCPMFRLPSSRIEFWQTKIAGNLARDSLVATRLSESGWRIGVVWECALKGRGKWPIKHVTEAIAIWLHVDLHDLNIRGHKYD